MARLIGDLLAAGTLADREQPTLVAGDDLVLRPWREEDAPQLVEAYADPDIEHWHHRSMDLTEAHDWIRATHRAWRDERDAEWAVTTAGDELATGRVALRGLQLSVGQAEVSYWTAPAHRRERRASRAVDRLSSWALHEVGLWRLRLSHSTRNPGSCRVAEAAGFRQEARFARAHLHADGWHDVHVHTRFRVPRADPDPSIEEGPAPPENPEAAPPG